MDRPKSHYFFFVILGTVFTLSVLKLIYRLTTKNFALDVTTENTNVQRQSQPTQVPNQVSNQVSINVEPQEETFIIPLQHNDKVQINHEGQLKFYQPCTLQTNKPFGEKTYFEIMLFGGYNNSMFSCGLAPIGFPFNSIPGFLDGTIALDANLGLLYRDGIVQSWDFVGKLFKGDVLGVAVQSVPGPKLSYEISFARNGNYGPSILYSSDSHLIPTIHATTSCCISVNFGQTEFIYDSKSTYRQNIGSSSTPLAAGEVLPSYEIESFNNDKDTL